MKKCHVGKRQIRTLGRARGIRSHTKKMASPVAGTVDVEDEINEVEVA